MIDTSKDLSSIFQSTISKNHSNGLYIQKNGAHEKKLKEKY